MAKRSLVDEEFHMPQPLREQSREIEPPGAEFSENAGDRVREDEQTLLRVFKRRKESRRRSIRAISSMTVAASILTMILVTDSFGMDVLKTGMPASSPAAQQEIAPEQPPEEIVLPEPEPEPVSEPEPTQEPEPEPGEETKPPDKPVDPEDKPYIPPTNAEAGDDAFPSLGNLEPNGSVPGYGVIDEEFVILEYGAGGFSVLHSGKAYDGHSEWQPSAVSGMSYNRATNTLTLSNYNGGGLLNVNLMGNGFKLNLIGSNSLDGILMWGFMYGGSITITGSGSLTVNENMNMLYGIELQCENSQTCVMIDSSVTVDVYGSEAAIIAFDSQMDKAVYFLKPLVMMGGNRVSSVTTDEDGNVTDSYLSVFDVEEGHLATHVTFSKVVEGGNS